MRIAYADPPYIGQGSRYKCPEVDHKELVDRLVSDFPDGGRFHSPLPAFLKYSSCVQGCSRWSMGQDLRHLQALCYSRLCVGARHLHGWGARRAARISLAAIGAPPISS